MGRTEGQRGKILYVLKVLWEETDELHPLSAVQLAKKISAFGISCERKSIYKDLEELSAFGFDIVRTRQGAYLASRQFELPELRLLVDAIQSSKFITEKKSDELIAKLGSLLSHFDSKKLRRQVFVKNRVKSMNESIYYNVDAISEGIRENCQISFIYYAWNVRKEMKPRKQGKRYVISPWFLEWEDEKYYLVGFDETANLMKHFRVDKMNRITVLCNERKGQELYETMDMAVYGRQAFGMFGGRKEIVSLMLHNELAGVVIDRFGKEVWMHSVNETCFSVKVEVMVSNQFFGWLLGLGSKAQIVEPVWVKTEYQMLLLEVLQSHSTVQNWHGDEG